MLPTGVKAEVVEVKHKYLGALHEIFSRFEEKFDGHPGLTSVPVDPERSDGLDDLIQMLKERSRFMIACCGDY